MFRHKTYLGESRACEIKSQWITKFIIIIVQPVKDMNVWNKWHGNSCKFISLWGKNVKVHHMNEPRKTSDRCVEANGGPIKKNKELKTKEFIYLMLLWIEELTHYPLIL